MPQFDDAALRCFSNSLSKGFYDSLDLTDFVSQAKQLAMIHSEVTEVLEALRKEKGEEAVLDELSDIIIRVLDFYAGLKEAGMVKGSLDEAFETKMSMNKLRPHMHGVLG